VHETDLGLVARQLIFFREQLQITLLQQNKLPEKQE
jgi:hypothetical protein